MTEFLVWFGVAVALYCTIGYLMGYKPQWFYDSYSSEYKTLNYPTLMVLMVTPLWPVTFPLIGGGTLLVLSIFNLVNFFKKQGAKRIPQ